MPDDLLTRLAAADPAAGVTPSPDRLAATYRTIVATPARGERRARRRRPAALVVAAILAVAAAAGAAGVIDFQTPKAVDNDYQRVIQDIPLPAGYRWPGPVLPKESHVLFAGHNAALVQASLQALCAWEDAWLRAADGAARSSALTGYQRVYAMTPRHPEGASEDVGGIDSSTVDYTNGLVADMRAGTSRPIARDLALNCTIRR